MLINVLVELSNRKIDKTFTYLVPQELESKIKIGCQVLVPFGSLKLAGFVLEILTNYPNSFELKEIISIIDSDIILTKELLELGKYISKTTLSTLISSYQAMLPVGYKASKNKKIKDKYETYILVNYDNLKQVKLTNKQMEIINLVLKNKNITYKYLKKINSSVDTLIKKNILIKDKVKIYRLQNNYQLKEKLSLTIDQENVVNKVNLLNHKTYLLHGVTGSGKTEVYMELIEKVLNMNKTAIVLIPEISLTPQTVRRFKERFGSIIAIFHSGLSDSEKYDEYTKIKKENIKIVIGARSAIFTPLDNIGIIIIDEEHSSSYKQDKMPRYDAKKVAIWRGKYHNAPVILGSATPTLESYARSLKGVYELLTLKNRINKTMPNVLIIDMFKSKKKTKLLSISLYNKIKEVLEEGNQVILFLNKRGYATTLSCSNCGKTFTCLNCDITLTYHKTSQMLRCHYCGYATLKPKVCPNCHSQELTNSGMGTELLEEELKELFPEYSLVRMDFDTTSRKGSHEQIINDFKDQKYQILIGTQMIAKGLDFPKVTLVGVINADNSLNIPDFRSSEVTFDLLNQVSGRSGRGELLGSVIIQTYNPDHYAIFFAKTNNYVGFFQKEMQNRKLLNYPPYYYLVLLRIKSDNYQILVSEVNKIKEYLINNLKLIILGPSLANPFRLNSVYRFNIIIKYKQELNLYEVLNKLLDHYQTNSSIKIEIDFDPKSF